MPPLTKIVATLGPASTDHDVLCRMIESGLRVARLNFSHGTFDDFARFLEAARAAEAKVGIPLAVLGDLSGPKIRVGDVPEGPISPAVGDELVITDTDQPARRDKAGRLVLGTNQPCVVLDAREGHRLFINDGALRTVIKEKHPHHLVCRVTASGPVSRRKGLNLPDSSLSIDTITARDAECIDWSVDHKVDWLALSFARSAQDMRDLKLRVARRAAPGAQVPRLMAKIETPEALTRLEEIVAASDALMVARGDLGVEMDLEEVPVLQKRIVQTAQRHGRAVIVATQMLESMISAASPTRAEVSDVANAVLDGADGVMLSAETSVGKFPVDCVRVMAKTALLAEKLASETTWDRPPPTQYALASRHRTAALARAVHALASGIRPKCVVAWTEEGGTARYLSQIRLPAPIVAFSSREAALRRCSLLYGVRPVLVRRPDGEREFLAAVDAELTARGWAAKGDPVVLAYGSPFGTAGTTNTLLLHYVGDAPTLAVPWI